MQRVPIILTKLEHDAYSRIRPLPGDAFLFWRRVASARGLDPATVLSVGGRIERTSALPLGHGKHWCWPSELKMKRRPRYDDRV